MAEKQIEALEQRIRELELQLSITEKKLATFDDQGSATDGLLQSLINSLPVYISYLDAAHCYRFVNRLYEGWMGLNKTEILGNHLRDVAGEQHYKAVKPYLDRCLSGETVHYEVELMEPDGLHIYDVVNVPDLNNEAVVGVFVLVNDISRRKHDEIALQESDETIHALLDAVEETLLLVDSKRNLLAINRTGAERFGSDSEDMVGHCIDDFVSPDIADLRLDKADEVIKTRKPVSYEEARGGRQYKTSMYPVLDAQGDVSKIAAFGRDVTENEQVLEELRKARDVAEKANEAKSKFLARMSHELRTPLNSIIGYAQLYELKNKQDDFPDNKYISEILKAGRHLLQLITDLLDLSKIEVDQIEICMESVDVKKVIEDSLATIRPLANERGISINYDSQHCVNTWVYADRVRVKQVMLNLLSNAVKYNCENGHVDVECEKTWGNRLRISVTDSGPGIQEKELENLFDPFSRLYLETYAVEGTGIGLALSKQLTELMKGRIGVDSQYERGSTFWFELNSSDMQQEAGQQERNEIELGAAARSTLLYVEDSPTHMNLVEDILESMPEIRFIGANTPMLGLDLARTHKPDLILLDISLPGMDGYEFFSNLKKQKACCNIPVVGLSASAMSHEIEKGLRLGFSRYLTKPIDIVEFKNVIKEVLREYENR